MRQINLLPEPMQKIEEQKVIRNAFGVSVVPTLIILIVVHVFLSWYLQDVIKMTGYSTDYSQVNEFGDIKEKIDVLSVQMGNFYRDQKPVLMSVAQQSSPPFLLKNLSVAASNRVWFKKMELDFDGKICRIEGQSYNTRLVSEFMLELKKILSLKSVELNSMEKTPEGHVNFMIVCNL